MSISQLVNKYNVPGPRYTSYPTVPYWDNESMHQDNWLDSVRHAFRESNKEEGISLYIHLPFCESLCTFCACHKRITKRHSVEEPYIETLLKEWYLYMGLFDERPKIKEIHLGGGTPTFFQAHNLQHLINGILKEADVAEDHEFGFEGHPNNTTKEHLQILYDLGFRRCSFGVQDYDEKVQRTINRVQSFENVKRVTGWAREIGYDSLSHDLVFGLPHQSKESIRNSIKLTGSLRPDRISYYSYAHVPWIKNVGQRGFNEADLPTAEQKRELYHIAKELLFEMGYNEIGMDHFALETDALYEASQNGRLHRNFMGYTANKTHLMLGLGMSAISDSWYGFAQNNKSLEEYTSLVNSGVIPIFRGHALDSKDLVVRQHILNIMCQFETSWEDETMRFQELPSCIDRLEEMISDDLLEISDNRLLLKDNARPFVRNICMAFDLHLNRSMPETKLFSMTI